MQENAKEQSLDAKAKHGKIENPNLARAFLCNARK